MQNLKDTELIVTLVQNNSNTWTFSNSSILQENMEILYSGNDFYTGASYLTFRPSNLKISAVDVLKVTIADNSNANNPTVIDEYEVNFFDLNKLLEEDNTQASTDSNNSTTTTNNVISSGASSWATDYIEDASTKNLLKNMDDITSNYKGYISREQFCRLIMNCFDALGGTRLNDYYTTFMDTTNSEIIHANMLGIVNGKFDTKFAPDDLINKGRTGYNV